MYFLMCFLVRVFGTITGKITTEYLTAGYYRPVTGVTVPSNLRPWFFFIIEIRYCTMPH